MQGGPAQYCYRRVTTERHRIDFGSGQHHRVTRRRALAHPNESRRPTKGEEQSQYTASFRRLQ